MDLAELEARHRRLVWPLSGCFLGWYLLLVVLAGFARPLMAARVAGAVTVGYLLALSQFPMTFLVAWWYARAARRRLDPRADRLAAGGEPAGGGPGEPLAVTGEVVPLWPTATSR